jgi:hypothetical protein
MRVGVSRRLVLPRTLPRITSTTKHSQVGILDCFVIEEAATNRSAKRLIVQKMT